MDSRPLDPQLLLDDARWMRRLAEGLVRDPHAAEDLVQETWLAALRTRPDDRGPARPWLARVLRNLVRQRVRGVAREAGEHRRPGPDDGVPPADELAERAELSARVVHAVLALDEPYRSTVLLRYHEGLSSSEIARRQRVPAATVRSRLKRALDELRTRLDGSEGGRGAWLPALLPLVHAGGWTQGVLAVKGNVKLAAGVALVLVAGLATSRWWRPVVGSSAPPAPGGGVATLAPPPALEDEDAPLAAAAPHTGERVEAIVTAAPAAATGAPPGAPLVTRLVDERTGEPVPHFAVTVRSGERVEDAVSDASGMLTTTTSFEDGSLELTLDDHDGVPRNAEITYGESVTHRTSVERIDFDRGEPSPELLIEVGPTYLLDLTGASDVVPGDLRAAMLGPDDRWREFLRLTTSAPLRPGTPPWVRFAPLPVEMLPAEPPWRLEVRSRDGMAAGVATVDSIVGVHRGRVRVELSRRGRVEGRVSDSAGGDLEGIELVLTSPGFRASAESDLFGQFDLRWIPPGVHVLRTASPRHREHETEVVVEPGGRTALALRLEALPNAGPVAGVLTSASASYCANVVVFLTPESPGGRTMRTSPVWKASGGEMRGSFRFDDVPLGDYSLSVHSFLDAYPWSPATVGVTPPVEDVELFCDDLVPTSTLVFHVTDALTGALVDGFDLHHVGKGGIHVALNGLDSGSPALTGHPDVGALDWRISLDGYAPAFGDLGDFGPPLDGVRTAEVVLRRGWAAQFRVTDASTGAPVEGAEIIAAGEVLARTDERGIAGAYAAAVPASVEVRHGDRVLARGDPMDASNDRRSLFRDVALAPRSR